MENKKKNIEKSFLRKRRRLNDGCFGSKKRKVNNSATCQASTSNIQEMPTSDPQFTDLEPVQQDLAISNSEMISEQGCTVDKIPLANSGICDEAYDENFIISPSNDKQTSDEIVSGRRILDVNYFFNKFKQIANHNALINCGNQCLSLIGEKRIGLKSKFKFRCDMCAETFYIDSEDPVSTDNVDINIGAVIGVVSSGIGYSQFEEVASSMNIPIFSEKYFLKLQDDVYNKWEAIASELMEAANERERQAAIAF